MRKRTGKDIWENLYEFILIETKNWLDAEALPVNKEISRILNLTEFKIKNISPKKSQRLTHQLITGQFIHIKIQKPLITKEYIPVTGKQLQALPFPKFITSYLADKNVSLN